MMLRQGQLCTAMSELVGEFAGYDLYVDPTHDALSEEGLQILLSLVLRVAAGGLIWLGTPCSSWVALSRSFTKRSAFQPEGPPVAFRTQAQHDYLEKHNQLANISAFVIRTARALGIDYILEQPVSSLLFQYPPMVQALKDCTSCHIWMSAFGADSPKPLMLKGSASQILETIGEVSKQRRRKCPLQTHLAKASVDSRGVKRFTGKRSLLQASSAYTREMGLAVAYAHLGFNPSQIMSMLGEWKRGMQHFSKNIVE